MDIIVVVFPFVFFVVIYVSSFVVVIGADDWMVVWLGLEMNMISFLCIMYNRRSMVSVEVCMSYYVMQGLASALFVVIIYFYEVGLGLMCYMALMISVGGGPFYFWLVSVFMGMSWGVGWVMIVLQKVLPFWLSSSFLGEYVYIFSLVSLLVGAMGVFNQLMVKRLVIYSSIYHLGWMMISVMVSWGLWLFYLFLYGMVMCFVFFFFEGEGVSSVRSWVGGVKKWVIIMGIFNMGGIPPMLGFFLSVYVLCCLLGEDKMMILILVLVSVLVLYAYFRLMFDLLAGSVSDSGFLVKLEMERWGGLALFSLLGVWVGAGLMWGM